MVKNVFSDRMFQGAWAIPTIATMNLHHQVCLDSKQASQELEICSTLIHLRKPSTILDSWASLRVTLDNFPAISSSIFATVPLFPSAVARIRRFHSRPFCEHFIDTLHKPERQLITEKCFSLSFARAERRENVFQVAGTCWKDHSLLLWHWTLSGEKRHVFSQGRSHGGRKANKQW